MFEQLFFDIENINIFGEEDITFYIESEEKTQENEKLKMNYRLFNHSNYNELFNDISKTVTWYSDETSHKIANVLKIKKYENFLK